MTSQHKARFLNGQIFSPMLSFAVPILFSMLFQQLYNTVDTFIVGHILGDQALATIGAASPVYDLLIGFALGFGNGLSIVIARHFGSGDMEALKKAVAATVVIGMLVSLVITGFAQMILMPLLVLLHTPAEILNEAHRYIAIITNFTVVMLAYNLCAGILRAVGNSVMPLLFLVFSSVLNILLDYIFVAVLHRGIGGAAEATVISQGISVIPCLIYIGTSVSILVPKKAHFLPSISIYGEMAAQGLSMGLMDCLVSAGSVILQSGINRLGYLTIAAHTAARRLYQFFRMPFDAFNQAVSTFVSQNFGADKPGRIRKAVQYSYLYSAALSVAITGILWLFSDSLLWIVSGSKETVVLESGALYLRIAAPCYFILSVLNVTRASLQAIGKKLMPVLSSVIEVIGKILFTLLFVPALGYTAVIICEPIIWCFMVVELLVAFWFNPFIKNVTGGKGHE